jgi:hypothetical protein
VKELHREWLRDGVYREAYEALKTEFEIARRAIDATTTQRTPKLRASEPTGNGTAPS